MILVLEKGDLQSLFDALTSEKYQLIGPRVEDAALVYDEIISADDLPVGYVDEQDGGKYRLVKSDRDAYFDYVVGQHTWKRYLYAPDVTLYELKRTGKNFEIVENKSEIPKRAFIGVRACEIEAIRIQDKILLEGPYKDTDYERRRQDILIVAVNCVHPGGTCFCASMGTGPRANRGFDLALTEIVEDSRHYFLIESGTNTGEKIMKNLKGKEAGKDEIEAADRIMKDAENKMGRHVDTAGVKELLYRNFENSRWEVVAQRCLNCGNCTLVCPTCFCINIEDISSLEADSAQRVRKWDSCFTLDHSYIYGGSVRTSAKARYRQWLTHKLASWIDQFGMSGCVGCGRCITWCPVGIDLTEEVRAIRESEGKGEIMADKEE
ncbi:MAG: sulfite reductase subunit A [candidate division Zixibacteria bacterium]|nr:sulfite reductase subunit A [candidate division Zixibacteria bacterium]NIR64072.1 sulfite reductase subunit A [candidate division Zixibacteria bacterium]NIS15401.1 sulfite reductase subunit A [candidate division Zixibacteria bacterium]NIS45970.1 sulfite reductase subunit A [candidate division Zixibacteria bacterium]NIT51929.1 sulfite reductase subunit A [candidate division Zixibacteria bacterium]